MKLKDGENVILWVHKRGCVSGDTGVEIKKLNEVNEKLPLV